MRCGSLDSALLDWIVLKVDKKVLKAFSRMVMPNPEESNAIGLHRLDQDLRQKGRLLSGTILVHLKRQVQK